MPFIKIGIVLLIGLFIALKLVNRPNPSLPTLSLQISGRSFVLEKAVSTIEHARGLSGRSSLCPQCGMIFIFPNESTRTFWMKDTLIPLDMLFLGSDGVINTIHTAQPQPGVGDLKLKLYSSIAPSQYVIELPASSAASLDLKPGMTIDLTGLNQ